MTRSFLTPLNNILPFGLMLCGLFYTLLCVLGTAPHIEAGLIVFAVGLLIEMVRSD